jgi:hypothetical protein
MSRSFSISKKNFKDSMIIQRKQLENAHSNENVDYIKDNFKMSIVKYKALCLLLSFTSHSDSVTNDAFFKYKTKINPYIFRKVLSDQDYFFNKYHNRIYMNRLFYRFDIDPKEATKSPFILEQGYILYFLLLRIKKHFDQFNGDLEYDEKIFQHIPQKIRADIAMKGNLIFHFYNIIKNTFKYVASYLKKKEESQSIEERANDDKMIQN